jgi:hypothetical protein
MRQINVLVALALAASTFGAAEAAVRVPTARIPVSPARISGNVIGTLPTITTIGSTVDPLNHDRNPYGLTIAPASGGLVASGDLVVCNFNNAANIQGLGTTLEVLAPTPGATPVHLVSNSHLTGCAAIAMGSSAPWVAAYAANDNPIVSGSGQLIDPINNYAWTGPWGQAFVAPANGAPAFYESNANDGSIVRINLGNPFTFDKIATGFPVNHGVPGQILAPSGLTYDAQRDILYVVDGASNALISIANPATIPGGGIVVVNGNIGGKYASRVKILASGGPLRAPISAALLYNGDIVVGNTANNFLLEYTPAGTLVAAKNLDHGAPGALFGIAATGASASTTKIYFNDDNDNTVKVLSR